MKYICNSCSKEFNESEEHKQIKSIFIRKIILECPYCGYGDVRLTKKYKLLAERRAKIIKIENE